MRLSRIAWLLGPVFCSLLLAQDSPPIFSGTWHFDAAKSQANDAGRSMTITIKDGSPKFDFKRIVEESGHSVVSQFACQIGGTQCDFDEGGHKAKVSLWYDGRALVILKTDGPKEDSVTQLKLTLSPDGNTLSIDLTHIVPEANPEKLVFEKSSSS